MTNPPAAPDRDPHEGEKLWLICLGLPMCILVVVDNALTGDDWLDFAALLTCLVTGLVLTGGAIRIIRARLRRSRSTPRR
ncbi:hypothetical protein [Microtetraspora malaysiensis]|uniref:hypothetical protein n=1 Tax=Microtetraspora malaysiensis TaxID=161358 RepID=UPI0012F792BA|nr:hypothetical protein [Microtetraspora malaysiensis]